MNIHTVFMLEDNDGLARKEVRVFCLSEVFLEIIYLKLIIYL